MESLKDSKAIRTVQDKFGSRVVLSLKPFDKLDVFVDDIAAYFMVDIHKRLFFEHSFSMVNYLTAMYRESLPMRFLWKNAHRARRIKQSHFSPLLPLLEFLDLPPIPGEVLRPILQVSPEELKRRESQALNEYYARPAKLTLTRKGIRTRMSVDLYQAIWRRVVPLLNADALRVTRAVRGDHALYNTLAYYPTLLRHAMKSRAIALMVASCLREIHLLAPMIPEDSTLEECASVLMGSIAREPRDILRGRRNNDPMRGFRLAELTPGFLAWTRGAKFTYPFCSVMPHQVLGAVIIHHTKITEKGIARLRTPRHWYTFHKIVVDYPEVVSAYLADPDEAIQLIEDRTEVPEGRWHQNVGRVARKAARSLRRHPEQVRYKLPMRRLLEVHEPVREGILRLANADDDFDLPW